MPITPSLMEVNIISALASKGMTGQSVQPTASAIAKGVSLAMTGMSTVISVDVGVGPGAGSGIGQFTNVIDTTLGGLITSQALSMGLIGQFTPSYCSAVAKGIADTIKTGVVNSVHGPVAGGTGIGQVIGGAIVGPTVGGLISANMTSNAMLGVSAPLLSMAIGNGFASWVPSLIVQIIIAGGGPLPQAGSGTGTIS